LRYGNGNVSIEMDDTLDRLYRNAIERAAPGVLERIEAETKAIHDEARRQWPVGHPRDPARRGRAHSREQLSWGASIKGNQIVGWVRNTAPWSPFIRPTKLYGSTTAFREWLQLPARKAARKLVKELGPVLTRKMTGG
jgi:hypothetical protein